jgi:twinkle protein
MGECIEKILHKECGSEALQVFAGEDGKVNGYCYACDTYVDNPYGEARLASDLPKPKLSKTKEELEELFKDIEDCGSCDLPNRRLRGDSLALYGIKIGMDTKTGKIPTAAYFPYTSEGAVIKYKVKLLARKTMWSIGSAKDLDLFGWEQAKASGARRLIITEGEWDAVALNKIFDMYTKPEYKDNVPAVVSLINGASSAGKDLARLAPKIRRHFQDIVFCFDDDEAGRLAVEAGMKALPEATSITLPSKDANACLMEGTGKAAFSAAQFRAAKPKNSSLVLADTLFEEAKIPAEEGVSWPCPRMTALTRGIRGGETTYIAAGEKMGKSELVNWLAGWLVKEHGWKVFMAKPEEAIKKSVKMMANKLVGKVFTDPHIPFDNEAYDRACEIMAGKVQLLGIYQHVSWDGLRADIVASAAWGAKAVFIDPLTCLTNGMSGGERNDKLMEIGQELAALALDLDLHIFIFAHLNKPSQGATPWDRGGKITTNYFAGSSGMARSCNYAMGLEGNKDPELSEEEQNMRKLVMLGDREFGESGYVDLFWNKNNHLFTQVG